MKQADIVVSLFLTADKDPAKTIQPAVRALYNPATCFLSGVIAQLSRLNTSGLDMRCIVKLIKKLSDRIKIVGRVQTQVLAAIRSRLRPLYARVSSVGRVNFISCRLAPSTASPMGMPAPSHRTERLTPFLPRSVGFAPVFFPTKRSFCHGTIHALLLPVNAMQIIVLQQPFLPKLQKKPGPLPFLKSQVRC